LIRKPYLALTFALIIWASLFIISKSSLTQLTPAILAATRLMVAFFVLLPIAMKKGFQFKMMFSKEALIYGTLGYSLHLYFFNAGLAYCAANIASMLYGLVPMFIIVLSYPMLNQAITIRKTIAALISSGGVAVIFLGGAGANQQTTFLGVMMTLISVLLWAFCSIYSIKELKELDSIVQTQIMFGAALITLAPMAVFEGIMSGIPEMMPSGILKLLYLGAFGSAGGIICWNYATKHIDTGTAGIAYNFLPALGVIFAAFLGESIGSSQIIGLLLISIGLMITASKIENQTKMQIETIGETDD
jgi:drug/metabolite transporter (DMT)-like permease